MGRVVVVGSSNTDLVTKGLALPRAGQTLIHQSFWKNPGGKGANQAVAAARAGAKVSLLGAVGHDSFGRESLRGLQTEGIKTHYVQVRKDVPSGVALIMLDAQGENLISVAPGANLTLSAAHVRRAKTLFRETDVALASLEVPLDAVAEALKLARQFGKTTILNPAPAPFGPLPFSLLNLVDYLTPNEHEWKALKGSACQTWLIRGRGNLIITRGAKGLEWRQGSKAKRIPSYSVKAVDTVGAGDAFNGALAAALAERRPLEEALSFSQAAAALAVTKPGAQAGLPRRERILRFMSRP